MYYDLHAHILPGVDDGPENMSDSVEMARVAASNGTAVLVATPHKRDVNENHSVDYVRGLAKELAAKIEAKGIRLKLLLGMENHLGPELPQHVNEGKALTINGSRYLLVELPFTDFPRYTQETLFQLQLQGLTPIIVHPERNNAIQRKPSLLQTLVERGVLAQVTAGSLVGYFGHEAKKSSEILLRQNLLHTIASDTHHHKGLRNPVISNGLEAAVRIVGREKAKAMVEDTPRAVVNNQLIEVEPPVKLVERKWWRFR